ncbi:MAG TPA: hypothetical protein VJY34_00540, partial [Roseiarcus sp.]|nr:hypothetical protein [Roseiarcus sp.]
MPLSRLRKWDDGGQQRLGLDVRSRNPWQTRLDLAGSHSRAPDRRGRRDARVENRLGSRLSGLVFALEIGGRIDARRDDGHPHRFSEGGLEGRPHDDVG